MALTKVSRGLLSTSIVDNGNATAITIDSSENVGIGNTSPDSVLTAVNAASTAALRIGLNNTSYNYMDADNNIFRNGAGTERIRIDSSGNLLVGKSSSSFTTAGVELAQGGTAGKVQIQRASSPLALVNLTNDGNILNFYKGTAPVGSIGTFSSRIYVGTGDTGLQFLSTADNIIPIDPSGPSNRDAAIDLGASGVRFKDLYLSGKWVSNGSNNTVRASFQVSGTQYGYINVATTGTLYSTSSDYRIKENVVALTNATERLKQLNPLRFSFIPDHENTIVDGFFAHEVADVVPEAVIGAKDAMRDEEYEVNPAVLDDDGNVITEAVMGTRSVPDYQGIDQSKLVPLLVATIQELEARITQLENN